MSLNTLPVNAFDVILLVVLTAGILRGRKRGMSEELMSLIKWVLIVAAGALLYQPVGNYLAQESPFTLLTSYIAVYILISLLIIGAFALVKHSIGGKLIGSDVFGKAEYYLGMGSGMVRYGCILIAVLAVLNARYFSPQEVRAYDEFQRDVYGSDFFPGLHSAQATVFETSLVGPQIREYLGFLLIKPTAPEDKSLHQQEYALPK